MKNKNKKITDSSWLPEGWTIDYFSREPDSIEDIDKWHDWCISRGKEKSNHTSWKVPKLMY
ncbi:MAG: hypothetical protein FWH18_12040 [Marinilabiliaceae bacterium]|nr:hypothetical protein [Marinilabiliaceae bacterium]